MKKNQVLVVKAHNAQLNENDKLRKGDLTFTSEVRDLDSMKKSDREFLIDSLKVCAEELPQSPRQRVVALFRSRRSV